MKITPFQVAQTFVGIKELPGNQDNPLILAMLQTCNPIDGDYRDEIPWCSAFVNFICKHLRLPRTHSLRARSWLDVGQVVDWQTDDLFVDADIVILKRGNNPLTGHVGFFAGRTPEGISILGGNQSNAVSIQTYPWSNVVGVRRLI